MMSSVWAKPPFICRPSTLDQLCSCKYKLQCLREKSFVLLGDGRVKCFIAGAMDKVVSAFDSLNKYLFQILQEKVLTHYGKPRENLFSQ